MTPRSPIIRVRGRQPDGVPFSPARAVASRMIRSILVALVASQAFLAPLAAAATCGSLPPTAPAIVPAARDEAGPRQATEQAVAAARSASAGTLLVGDSIFARWQSASADLGRPVVNFSVSGDRTENVLDRLDRAEFAATSIRQVVVLIGTNNLRRDDACEVAGGVSAIVGRLHERLPQAAIHVVSILPRGPHLRTKRREIAAVNRDLAADQERLRIRYIDAYGPFKAACAEQEECSLLVDRLHPGADGYTLLGRVIGAALGARESGN